MTVYEILAELAKDIDKQADDQAKRVGYSREMTSDDRFLQSGIAIGIARASSYIREYIATKQEHT